MKDENKNKGLEDLCLILSSLNSADECADFLSDLCTPAELQAMTGRFQVAKMLELKHSYRKIHALTGVSTATITRVARFLEGERKGYQKALEILKKKQS